MGTEGAGTFWVEGHRSPGPEASVLEVRGAGHSVGVGYWEVRLGPRHRPHLSV